VILFIDNDKSLFDLIKNTFSSESFVYVSDSGDALNNIYNNRVNLVFINPLVLGGFYDKFIEIIKNLSINIVFITENSEFILNCQKQDNSDYICKSIDTNNIITRVKFTLTKLKKKQRFSPFYFNEIKSHIVTFSK
jgi:two-component SAPR family response regulator